MVPPSPEARAGGRARLRHWGRVLPSPGGGAPKSARGHLYPSQRDRLGLGVVLGFTAGEQ